VSRNYLTWQLKNFGGHAFLYALIVPGVLPVVLTAYLIAGFISLSVIKLHGLSLSPVH
jgi:hypothetical protein